MKRSIIFLLSICVLLFSCSDGDDPVKEVEKPPIENKDPFITLKKSNIDFTNKGGSESITIESNVTWATKSSASWCTVSPTSGSSSTTSITLSAPANEKYDTRSCTVTIESGNISKTITVNQGENLGLLVTQDRYELGNEESTIKVEVKANVEFDIEIADEWITRVETRGLTTSQIEFKIAKNDTYGNREGSITIKQKGGNMSSTITIFQSQEDAIILSEKEFDLSSAAQSIDVEIKTNIDYEIIIPEDAKGWVSHSATRALRTETVVLDIAKNEDYDERTVEVIVKDKKTDLQEVVTIKQAANTGLIASEDKYEVSNEGEIIEVEVKANVNFKVDISESWITQVETRGLVVTKLQFEVHKNEGYDAREATITIFQTDGNLKSSIKVYQSQKDAIIISDKTVNLSNEKQAIDVELKTNVEFEVIIPQAAKSWVSYTPTRGLRTETLTLNIAENKDYDARSTEVYVKNKKTNLQDTLTINQAANTGLIVSDDKYEVSNEGEIIEVEVKANVNFKVDISESWITQVETRGLVVTKLQFEVHKNKGYDAREATITIFQTDGNLKNSIKVYQSQKDAIIISDKTVNLSNEKQAIDVELKTNVEFEVVIPEVAKSWVSYTPTRGLRTETLTLNITENKDYTTRSSEVYVKNKKTSLQDTLTINQDANKGLIVSPNKYELTNYGGTIEVEVKANVDYKVTISDNWITQVKTRGLITNIIAFNIAKNVSYSSREGSITISDMDGGLSSIIKVYQSQENAIILTEKEYNLSSRSDEVEVVVKTNIDFEIIIPADAKEWVSYTPTRGLRTELVVLNIATNNSEEKRSAKIDIKDKLTNLQESVTINQDGKEPGVYWVNRMGTLGSILNQTQKDTITTMIIKGEINEEDFTVMRSRMPNLKHLNLTDVRCYKNEIPFAAFSSKSVLQSIKLPVSITSIGINAFSQCSGLKSTLEIPQGVTYIGEAAFHGCSGLTGSLIIPDGVREIKSYAFRFCGFTGSLILPDGLTKIGESAFQGCSGLTGSLIIPDGVREIKSYAFDQCRGFNGSLKFPDGLTKIGDYAFNDCTGFKGTLILPNSLKSIGDLAFNLCKGFTGSLTIPESVHTLGKWAFNQCSGFNGTLKLSSGLTTIKECTFNYCYGFTGPLELPENLTSIENIAFQNCYGFTGSLIIPDGVTTIGDWAFGVCSGFTGSLKLPANLTTIGKNAFQLCTGFTGSLVIPDGVSIINEDAFLACSGFNGALILPKNLKEIKQSAFFGCSKLSGSLTIPNGVTAIGKSAFYGCEGFKGSLTLPSQLIYLESGAFNNCYGFTGPLTIPDGVKIIEEDVFSGCSSFNGSLKLPSGLTAIKSMAFNNCVRLKGTLNLPAELKSIGSWAFSNCSSITALVIGEKLERIDEYAFNYCRSIYNKIVFPISLKSIKENAFTDCYSVNSFQFPHSTPLAYNNGMLEKRVPVKVPSQAVSTYQSTNGWKEHTIIGY